MSKVLITGAQGFLGVRLTSYLKDKYEVQACSHSDLDITSLEHLLEYFRVQNPDFVVHCAAISDTGFSQRNPELSEQVNVIGTVNVAKACAEVGAKLVFMSSDQVYNGTPLLGGLPENVSLTPNSVYGQHKLEAERRVSEILSSAVALRLTWMYDRLDSPYKLNRNILVNLNEAYVHRQKLIVATREYRGITWVWDVVHRIPECFDLPGGAYNFGCENTHNSYDTYLAFAYLMGLPDPKSWLVKDERRFPDHPRNLSMSMEKLCSYGIDFPMTVEGNGVIED